ncbi:SAM-dependent methyltransferase [Fredinandcohnia sp. QZ13]|uniref:class I SAM-dependent methyltransferase n=1 Tax=Fredinandcohnia sp. QZ13 TaxID=3073144 RepID=UPI002853318E|nr:SAM-dependent methyltransferase [Fredinandcohnia sp. QZ13]MDR4888928.1 SAM-dependent methyltransferase [Fredinandcohnia sp. QZ13]
MQRILKELIKSSPNNEITYEQYMNTVLYHEEKGYYMKNEEKVGKKGDFITTSNISNVFGKLFASIFHKLIMLEKIEPFICEIGGGNGRFAKAVLDELHNTYRDTYKKITYILIETSAYHRRLQQELLPIGKKVIQFQSLDEAKKNFPIFNGILFSNELFDAFPVRVIEKKDDSIYEVKITLNKDDQLCEIFVPLADERIMHYLDCTKIALVNGQRFEVPLPMLTYLDELNDFLGNVVAFTVDYGYTNEEWMEPARRKGSLRGYYKHHLINNPLEYPGSMDLTTHIHFDTLISNGTKYGLEFVKKLRQDEFLLAAGILTFLQDNFDSNPFSKKSKQNRAIRSLIMDGGMSTAFHVLIQQKNSKINWDHVFYDK